MKLLVYANKSDLPNALDSRALCEALGLTTLKRRDVSVAGTLPSIF